MQRRALAKLKWDRTTYLVSSKVYWGGSKPNQRGLNRKHVVEACHAALKASGAGAIINIGGLTGHSGAQART